MLVQEIDAPFPESYENLLCDIQMELKDSSCCKCEERFMNGLPVMYVQLQNRIIWWHLSPKCK